MTPKDVCHLLTVGWTIESNVDYFCRLAEVCRTHDSGADDDELLYILTSEVVKAVYRASRYA
jgi:hypothetical protein